MIKLNDKYCIDGDGLNIILKEKHINMKKNEEVYNAIGYYGDFKALLNGMVNKEIYNELLVAKDIEELINNMNNFKQETLKCLEELKNGENKSN